MRDFKIKIFADGADISSMRQLDKLGYISGFTTNPTLIRKAGITDYFAFAKQAAEEFKTKSLSLEVISDDEEGMIREAGKLSALGENVMVKIPIVNSRGHSSLEVIKKLSAEHVNLNITAVFTEKQAAEVLAVLSADTENYISVFAGRIADTGRDAAKIVHSIVEMSAQNHGVNVLWASCREVYNIIEAENCGCHIITVTNDILSKLNLLGKDLEEFSKETAQMFYNDAVNSGFRI